MRNSVVDNFNILLVFKYSYSSVLKTIPTRETARLNLIETGFFIKIINKRGTKNRFCCEISLQNVPFTKRSSMWAKRVANEGTPPKYAVKASQSFHDMMARIVKSLRLMGIPLDPYGIDSTFLRYWSISFGLVILLLDVGINCKLFISLFTSNEDLTKNITTANVSLMIHMGNFVLSLVTLHTGLLISTSLNWKGFVNSLHQIEKLHIFKEEDYDKFNIIFRNGIITFLSLVCFHTIFYYKYTTQ